jgi:hypothetical protein
MPLASWDFQAGDDWQTHTASGVSSTGRGECRRSLMDRHPVRTGNYVGSSPTGGSSKDTHSWKA